MRTERTFLKQETRDRIFYMCWRYCSQPKWDNYLRTLQKYSDIELIAEFRRVIALWDLSMLGELGTGDLYSRIEEELGDFYIEKEFLCED